MMTVKEVSQVTGVSVRTLQYYDKIGLLKAAAHTEAGYRLYDDAALKLLQQILLYRELEFPLKDIKRIMCSPNYDRIKALEQQIELLEMKKAHIDNLIILARGLKLLGGNHMGFSAFDTKKLDEYAARAKASWGETAEYKEFEEKNRKRTDAENMQIEKELMAIFGVFGQLKDKPVSDPVVVEQVKKLQDYITEHFYKCTDTILASLGCMYAGGGEITLNIDSEFGEGTAQFSADAISAYTNS